MSKELKTIKYLLKQCPNETVKKDLLDIEKSLKAFEIIKDKLCSWSKLYINTDVYRVSNVLTIYDIDDKEKKLLEEVLL
jgi:hypothetical protein